jgi:mannose-6-phosphate isomerase-like protein (cupin superfamily)
MTELHEIAAARPYALSNDEGERIWFTTAAMTVKATASSTDGGLCLIETRAPVGHGPPLHVHHDEHEAFYVLEGELEIVCGPERYRAGPGAFAFLPRGIAHSFCVVGEAPVRMLTFGVPGGLEDFFRDAGRPAEHRGLPPQADLEIATLKKVAARHNHEIVGPPIDRAKQSRTRRRTT